MAKKNVFDEQIEEIHRLRKEYNEGNISRDELMAKLETLEQHHKRLKDKIKKYAKMIKKGGD